MTSKKTKTTRQKSVCNIHRKINIDVRDFIEHVPKVNEESITDYLLWSWGKIDNSLQVFRCDAHDKDKEHNISGADLEIFFLTSKTHSRKPLVIQSKKLLKEHNSYARNSLRYRDGTRQQMDKLIDYAGHSKTACYMFYSKLKPGTKVQMPKCSICDKGETAINFGVFITPLDKIEHYSDPLPSKNGKKDRYQKVSRSQIMTKCIPFHKVFCPTNNKFPGFLNDIASRLDPDKPILSDRLSTDAQPLPEYVRQLQNGVNIQKIRNDHFKEVEMPKRIVIVDLAISDDDDGVKPHNDLTIGLSPGGLERIMPSETPNMSEWNYKILIDDSIPS